MKENILFYVGIIKDLAPLIISLVAIWLTNRYQKHTKKLANDNMMKELFTEFNQRYDKLNDILITILKLPLSEFENMKDADEFMKISKKLMAYKINDYFNLCAEEYYWYKEGRIEEKVWVSWSIGMNKIYNQSPIIRKLWKEECKDGGYKSYYIDRPDRFFK